MDFVSGYIVAYEGPVDWEINVYGKRIIGNKCAGVSYHMTLNGCPYIIVYDEKSKTRDTIWLDSQDVDVMLELM